MSKSHTETAEIQINPNYPAVDGDRIARLRLAYAREGGPGTLTAFAKHAGISPSYLSMLERGRRVRASYRMLWRVAEALDVSPLALMHSVELDARLAKHSAAAV